MAISAALSLGSSPLLAQEVAPSLDLPPAAEAPPPQPGAPPSVPQQAPAIVLPQFDEAAATSARDAAPAEASPARPRRAGAAGAPRTAAGDAQRAAAAPPIARSAPAGDASPSVNEPILTTPVDLPAAAPKDATVATAEPAAARDGIDVPDEAIVAALLGLVGLGAAGFLATRRRRREDDDDENWEETYEPVAEETVVPATATERDFVDEPITSIPEELALRRPGPAADVVAERAAGNEPAAAQPFVMPEGPVPTGEARRRLIEEMVAAPPDEANPFTSYVLRRKRARIILGAREKQLRQQATEPFDWRTYRPPEDQEAASSLPVEADS